MIKGKESYSYTRKKRYSYLPMCLFFFLGFGHFIHVVQFFSGKEAANNLSITLNLLILIISIYFIFFGSLMLINMFKRGFKVPDLTIDNKSFIIFDHLFEHEIYWKEINKLEFSDSRNNCIEWQFNDKIYNSKRYAIGLVKNYMFKKLISKKVISFNEFSTAERILAVFKQQYESNKNLVH